MNWVYEIALRGAPDRAVALQGFLQTWLDARLRDACAGLPGLSSLDVYTPAEGQARDP